MSATSSSLYNLFTASHGEKSAKCGSECEHTVPDSIELDDSFFRTTCGCHVDVATYLRQSCNLFSDVLTDAVIIELEGLFLLFTSLRGCSTASSICSTIGLYLRKHMHYSITNNVMTYIQVVMGYDPQSDDESDNGGQWVEFFKGLQGNWSVIKTNKLFEHFSKMLGILVTLELCNASDLQFKVKDYVLWEPKFKDLHMSTCDIVDAFLSSVSFFAETISLCLSHKSLSPLLMHGNDILILDEEITTVHLWWDLVRNGNLKRVTGHPDVMFDKKLEDVTTKVKSLIPQKTGYDKHILTEKFTRLLKVKNDYITYKISSGVRKAPFCLEFFGDSSQGKTTCADQMVDALLASAGLPTGKEYRATYNASDKFMSSWTTDKLVMTIDDMANDKKDFVERPPTRAIIDFCNNQCVYANMADIQSKGKVFVEPSIVVVSTNKKDLDAGAYSNCPYSVQRRMHYVVTVQAKPEFQFISEDGIAQGIDPSKVRKYTETFDTPPLFDDIWWLTVEKAVKPAGLDHVAPYAPVQFNGKTLNKVSFATVVGFLVEQYADHNLAQECIVDRMMSRQKKFDLCPVEGCNHVKGYCPHHSAIAFNRQFSVEEKCAATRETCQQVLASYRTFYESFDWMSYIPRPKFGYEFVIFFIAFLNRHQLHQAYKLGVCCVWFAVGIASILLACINVRLIIVPLGMGLIFHLHVHEYVKRKFLERVHEKFNFKGYLQTVREHHLSTICKAGTVLGVLYACHKIYKLRKRMYPQGDLSPTNSDSVAKRDSEANVWSPVVIRSLPINTIAANTTSAQMRGLILKNLVHATITTDTKILRANILFLRSNVIVIPRHYFISDVLHLELKRKDPSACGGTFSAVVDLNISHIVPGTDLVICYIPNGGSAKDLTRYFPSKELQGQHGFELLWRYDDGTLYESKGLCNAQLTANVGSELFPGIVYKSMTRNTFPGLCGGVAISTHKPLILGFHLGGRKDTPYGCSGTLFSHELENALADLRSFEGVLLSGTAEKFETQVLGINVVKDEMPHFKSPMNYLPEGSQVEYYGQCIGATTFRSDVKVTPISHAVMEVTGEPNIYGPPIIHPQWKGWQDCLANLSIPAKCYEPCLLAMAVKDYKRALEPIFSSELWRDARPLTDHENINGIPGKKFMDAIKVQTSIGFPLTGSKEEYMSNLEPVDGVLDREFNQVIMDEIARCENCYAQGQRAYTIAKACKKDEVLSKAKCRIFYGNPIALTFLVRKYYLSLVRVLQMNPLVSECAVGVNSHGPEWDQLHKHIFRFGKERILAGDYSKYDQKIPSQLILAALRILIDLARLCDYSEQDLKIMEAMSGDLVYAIIAFNGDLIGLTEGTHISGNSLTVIINGICGSLNLRCKFYDMHPYRSMDQYKPFRDYVSLMTYGDDNAGSVSSEISDFNIKTISQFLGEYGQIYTMPDKESELVSFLPYEDFEFLKRKSVYHEDLGVHVGALDDKSCFKMLHCFLRGRNSPISEEHAAALNIDTALREWQNHGEVKYEKRRKQMIKIAQMCKIEHLCTRLDETYNDFVTGWKDQYA